VSQAQLTRGTRSALARLVVLTAILLGIGQAGWAVQPPSPSEPISPVPAPVSPDANRVALGASLFSDTRLSGDGTRSCQSCHDLSTNGANNRAHDEKPLGTVVAFNTNTVFNAALSFRLNWQGNARSLQQQAGMSLNKPEAMNANIPDIVARLQQDPATVRRFNAAYGHGPDEGSIVDALASFETTLLTPDSRFDRWLRGDATAITIEELEGYKLFKSIGCVSCHQGVNVGGNLFERRGVIRPLYPIEPRVVRVPSLRNVAVTAPYFHDGSVATLQGAVRKMASAQLGADLSDQQVDQIVAFLNTLTGRYNGRTLTSP
jgi:cytochrome c peroxidase